LSVTAQPTWKKSHANIVDACAQELPPRRVGAPDRGRRYPQPLENAADRRRPHAVAEFEQLTLDSLVSPALILPGHALDQHGNNVLNGRTPDAVRVRPLLGHQATMPTQIVLGVTNRCTRSIFGMARTSAANTARSAQSRRGFGLALRSTATS
jgi:hypothetical protein